MTTWRIASMTALFPLTIFASTALTACNDDVDTPPWLANYVSTGYGGAKGGAGGAAGAHGGAAGSAGGAVGSAGGASVAGAGSPALGAGGEAGVENGGDGGSSQ